MSVNNDSLTEDTEMGELDGEKVVTMMDVLQEQQDFEDDANAVLGASDHKECTYAKGYIKRQAVYACLTCCSEARDDPEKRAGVCLACSLNCHENHELIELYTKRNFCCDCGNTKFNSNPCLFTSNKMDLNSENVYNQNFSGLYCTCHRPYPDPDTEFEDEMIQCIVCEDWLHSQHLEAKVPPVENYFEMICKGCMDKNEFLHDYSEYAVNIVENGQTVNGLTDASHLNGTEDVNVDDTDEITDQSINVDKSIKDESSHEEKCIPEADGIADECMNETNDDISEKTGDIIDVKSLVDTEKHNEMSSEPNIESIAKSDVSANESLPETPEQTLETTVIPEVDSANGEQHHDKKDVAESKTENEMEPETDAINTTEETTSDIPEISSTEIDAPSNDIPAKSLPSEANLDAPLKKEDDEAADEPENKDSVESALISDSNPEDEPKAANEPENKDSVESALLSESNPKYEPKVEESNVDNKQIDSIEEEPTEVESVEKPEEKIEAIIENNQIDSSEIKTNDLSLESNADTDKIINTPESEVQPETVTTSETVDSKETNGDSSYETADVSMAETDTSKTEITDLPVTANEIEMDSSTTEVTDIPLTTNEIEMDSSTTEVKDIPLTTNEIDMDSSKTEVTELPITTKEIEMDSCKTEVTDLPLTTKEIEMDSSKTDITDLPITLNGIEKENKRKLSTEDQVEDSPIKKLKGDSHTNCIKPKNVKKIHKGATFWPGNFRQKLCKCNHCLKMYKDLSVLFLIDLEDTVSFYEALGKEKSNGTPTQYEQGLEALSSLDRTQQINALTEYNLMRDKLLDFLKSFKERKEVVKEEDIKAFFAGMKPKREPDGVYFCR